VKKKPEKLLWLSDAHGVYLPQAFAASFLKREQVSGVTPEEWSRLSAGPDKAWYWETWENVVNNAVVTDEDDVKYKLYEAGDLWLIPEGMEWSDAEEGYVWPEEGA
jgi:hypothetical protein